MSHAEFNSSSVVKGYKVFESDWTCRGKQYTCPGKFEEDVTPQVCSQGMHFCEKLTDCFSYYDFSPANRVAEVIAYGATSRENSKCATNRLEIVREIPWSEVLEMANTDYGNSGGWNSGCGNSGDWNSGDGNSGDRNTGDGNSGDRNTGDGNSGDGNSGYDNAGGWNSGCGNSGDWNSGDGNSGDWNSGDGNLGNHNTGNDNSGDWNSGYDNAGGWNSGDGNLGNRNSGDRNSGDRNSGDWNSGDGNSGCFNTVTPTITLFNRPSNWTIRDWVRSEARALMEQFAHVMRRTEDEDKAQRWWRSLEQRHQEIILSIPNFDADIFKEITGIDVRE